MADHAFFVAAEVEARSMNARETAATISQSTPVTLGIVGAIVSGVFFGGIAWERLNDNDTADRRRDQLIEKMDERIDVNERRADLSDQRHDQGEQRIRRLEDTQ